MAELGKRAAEALGASGTYLRARKAALGKHAKKAGMPLDAYIRKRAKESNMSADEFLKKDKPNDGNGS